MDPRFFTIDFYLSVYKNLSSKEGKGFKDWNKVLVFGLKFPFPLSTVRRLFL